MTPRIRFDFSAIDPRHRAIIIAGVGLIIVAIVSLVIFLSKGDQNEVGENITPSLTVTLSPTLPTPTIGPPTETPTLAATPTLTPYEYVVQTGDTLFFIIQLFGYRDTAVVPELIALN